MPNSCSEVNDCYLHMRDWRYSIHIVEIDLADYQCVCVILYLYVKLLNPF